MLVEWDSVLLVIEAKHGGGQRADQWVEQVRAVRGNDRFKRMWVVLVAVGGASAGAIRNCAAEAEQALDGMLPELWWMRWETPDVHAALERLQERPNLHDGNPHDGYRHNVKVHGIQYTYQSPALSWPA